MTWCICLVCLFGFLILLKIQICINFQIFLDGLSHQYIFFNVYIKQTGNQYFVVTCLAQAMWCSFVLFVFGISYLFIQKSYQTEYPVWVHICRCCECSLLLFLPSWIIPEKKRSGLPSSAQVIFLFSLCSMLPSLSWWVMAVVLWQNWLGPVLWVKMRNDIVKFWIWTLQFCR